MRGVKRPLVVMATGLGKTATAMSIPWRVNPGKMLFLADRRELLRQAWKAAKLWNPTLDVGLDHETYRAAPQQDLVIGSIPAIGAKNTKRLLGFYEDHFKTVFFDEAHHAAAATHIRAMKRFAGADQIIGLTATPFRHDGFDLANIFDEIVATYDLTWGMEHGWLVDVRSFFVRSGVDISDLETRGGDFAEESLELALNTDYRNSLIIGALNEYAFDRKSILIFAASTGHVKILVDQLNRYGWKAEGVVGATPKAERKEIFERFANGETRVMVGCQVPQEGYDNPRIDCVMLARPTKSVPMFCFDTETEVLTPSGWRSYTDNITEIYQVDIASMEVSETMCRGKIVRPLDETEKVFGVNAPMLDMVLTGDHRVVRGIKHRTNKQAPVKWSFVKADNIACRSPLTIPVAGYERVGGVDYTDDELRLAGMWCADGGGPNAHGGLTISQSTRHSEHVAYIDGLFDRTGVKCTKRIVAHAGDSDTFCTKRHDVLVWSFSYGNPRGDDKHKVGYAKIAPLFNKSFPSVLSQATREQLLCFIEGLNVGNGATYYGDYITWKPRTMTITMPRLDFVNRMQSLCVRRGIRCNVVLEPYNNAYTIHIDPTRDNVTIGPIRDRSKSGWGEINYRPSTVWCVSVDSGAIICRRNGKVFVTGNSQMVGRGLRQSPETGKIDLLLLDMVDACRNKDVAHLSDLFGVREFDCMGEGFLGIQKKVKKAQDLGIDPESGDASSLDEKIKAMEGFLGGRIVEIPTQAVQIDLFKRVNTPLPEVDALSVFRWARDPNGTYILPAASLHKPKLRRDAVGNWTMEYQSPSGAIAETLGKSDKPPFKKADSIMKRILPETGKPWDFFSRNASWRNRPAQKEDIDRLRRYSVDVIPDGLTRGAAADAIALIKAQREG